ncbi:hypothetical protein RhiirA5_425178 [Rhizophagus irregularis]|uniref:Uncharacterized protein n=1 Tax=Rhizophagus irregularis TaxID=588596 RepID=A0A2N0P6K6_9GLOM|nr:hypothetical protein RhiirA5_425178 [Rhizophagus irregularis]
MYNRIKYKSEMLASEHLIDIFRLNILQEYDWSLSSLKKEQARTDLTNDLDNELRVYKIKNFIKELPIYEILFKRGNNAIITEACIRCYSKIDNYNMPENWDHVWECTRNEYTEEKIVHHFTELERLKVKR